MPGRISAQDASASRLEAGRGGSTEPVALSLGRALDRALESDEEVRGARARLAQARAGLRIARALRFPRLDALLSYTRQFRSPFDVGFDPALDGDTAGFTADTTLPLDERVRRIERALERGDAARGASPFQDFPLGQDHTWLAALDAEWLVWNGGRLGAEIDAAGRAVATAVAEVDQAEADVALVVKQAYYDALLAQQRVAIARAGLAQAEDEVALARARRAAGAVSELEALRAEVERDNLTAQLDDALDALDLALLDLKRAAEVSPVRDVVLTAALCPPGTPAPVLPPPDAAFAVIEARRPSIIAAREEVARLNAEVRAERSDVYPTVTATGRLGEQAFPDRILPAPGDWRDDWSLGIRVDWPVFTGFRRGAEIQLARGRVAEAAAALDRLRETARSDYVLAYRRYARARDEIATRSATIARARRVYELTLLRYEEGLGLQIEVTEARVALQQARTNLAEALRDYYAALARAEYAIGRPIAESVVPPAACPDGLGPLDP
ncbi:MAG: TolC family protein [Gemmatimonadota bacterium]